MSRTTFLLAIVVTTLASIPAQAQQVRAFVSGNGADTNPCTEAQPCRTFQKAHDTVAANGTIWVLDPAGYRPLTITKGVSIQAGGMGAITQTTTGANAITVSVATSDPVMLNGLVLDGAGTGQIGISITSGASVQILNSIVRKFMLAGVYEQSNTPGSILLIQDTIASDNGDTGIVVAGFNTNKATLNRITANNNQFGVSVVGNATIANSVIFNNSNSGLFNFGTAWLSKNVISGNLTGVTVGPGGTATVNSYGDNYIRNNGTPVSGSLTPVTTQ
jgi:hypothetical protein